MKTKSLYVCQSCGSTTPRWSGKCPSCGDWNTLVEELQQTVNRNARGARSNNSNTPIAMGDIELVGEERLSTGSAELDRVLGGGATPGSIVLVGGEPGIGKSTLMLQMCREAARHKPLYVTGEESLRQIKLRAQRLQGVPNDVLLLAETNVQQIIQTISSSAVGFVVIDSIQTMYRNDIESGPGSVAQVRECAALLMNTAKQTGKPIFLVGHVTKEGTLAGPKILEHTVDTVLQFEGERVYAYRILRAVKNRYGSTNEIGVFEMEECGLREVPNPSEIFLSERNAGESGTSVGAAIEGARALLIEVQALVSPTSYGVPQRTATGYDYKRLQMILAVLEKRLGLQLGQHDVFVNIAGGMRIDDPGVDLAVASAIVSSYRDIPIVEGTVMIGEIGLTGEVRSVSSIETRIKECEKLGFSNIIAPKAALKRAPQNLNVNITSADRIVGALVSVFAGEEVR